MSHKPSVTRAAAYARRKAGLDVSRRARTDEHISFLRNRPQNDNSMQGVNPIRITSSEQETINDLIKTSSIHDIGRLLDQVAEQAAIANLISLDASYLLFRVSEVMLEQSVETFTSLLFHWQPLWPAILDTLQTSKTEGFIHNLDSAYQTQFQLLDALVNLTSVNSTSEPTRILSDNAWATTLHLDDFWNSNIIVLDCLELIRFWQDTSNGTSHIMNFIWVLVNMLQDVDESLVEYVNMELLELLLVFVSKQSFSLEAVDLVNLYLVTVLNKKRFLKFSDLDEFSLNSVVLRLIDIVYPVLDNVTIRNQDNPSVCTINKEVWVKQFSVNLFQGDTDPMERVAKIHKEFCNLVYSVARYVVELSRRADGEMSSEFVNLSSLLNTRVITLKQLCIRDLPVVAFRESHEVLWEILRLATTVNDNICMEIVCSGIAPLLIKQVTDHQIESDSGSREVYSPDGRGCLYDLITNLLNVSMELEHRDLPRALSSNALLMLNLYEDLQDSSRQPGSSAFFLLASLLVAQSKTPHYDKMINHEAPRFVAQNLISHTPQNRFVAVTTLNFMIKIELERTKLNNMDSRYLDSSPTLEFLFTDTSEFDIPSLVAEMYQNSPEKNLSDACNSLLILLDGAERNRDAMEEDFQPGQNRFEF